MKTRFSTFSDCKKIFAVFISFLVLSSVTLSQISTNRLQLWLKADAGFVSGRPIDSATVSEWADQSGNGNDALQSNSERQPLFVNNGLNNKPVLSFDGVNDKLGLTGTDSMSQITLFIVQKIESGAMGPNSYYPIILGNVYKDGNIYGLSMRNDFSGNSPNIIDPATGISSWVHATAANCAAFDQWKIISVTTDKTMWNTTLHVNGIDAVIEPQGTVDLPISVPLGNSSGTGVGGIGGADGVEAGSLIFKGEIAEVILYDTVLTASERLAVEQYLADKYNISNTTGIEDSQEEIIPQGFTLSQNYPNPFNPSTTIEFQVPNSTFVNLKVYNILGKEVTTLVNEEKPVGTYEVLFNAAELPSGIYYYKLQAGFFVEIKKMILLK